MVMRSVHLDAWQESPHDRGAERFCLASYADEERLVLEEGTVLARKYKLTKPAGFGGMAQVWSATNLSTGAEICVKVFIAGDSDDEAVARFRREATAAARLSHRAIVRVFDLVELTSKGELSSGPNPYALAITMELLKGQTLGDHLAKKGKLPLVEALDVILPVCSALAHAHRSNIVHRDVKPDNIFLAEDADGTIEPKVLDFGVSKMRGNELGPLTFEGVMIGTPTFMSPEQARGARDVDARSDVFSVGILIHVLLTGINPFESKRFHETVKNIRELPAPLLEGVPDAIAKVVDKALSKEPSRRYADAGELGQALRTASGRAGATDSGAVLAAHPKASDSARDSAPAEPTLALPVKPLGGDSIITVPPASQGQEDPAPTMDPKDADDDDHAPVDSSDERRALLAKARRASARGSAASAVQAEIEDAQADSRAGERLQAAAEARKRAIKIVGGVLGVAIVIVIAAFLRAPDGSSSDGTKSPATSGTSPMFVPAASETAAPSASTMTSASAAPSPPSSASAAPSASASGAPAMSAAPSAAPSTSAAPGAPLAPAVPTMTGTTVTPPPVPTGTTATKIDSPPLPGPAASTASPPPAVTVTVTATAVPPVPTAAPAPPPPGPTAAPAPAPTGSGSIVRDPGF